MPVAWTSELSTGIRTIDLQHEELVDMINAFQAAVSRGEAAATLDALLPRLAAYALFHFGTEEALLAELPAGHGHAQAHLREHAAFAARVEAFRTADARTHTATLGEFGDYLSTWIVQHIMKTDQELARLLAAGGGGRPPLSP